MTIRWPAAWSSRLCLRILIEVKTKVSSLKNISISSQRWRPFLKVHPMFNQFTLYHYLNGSGTTYLLGRLMFRRVFIGSLARRGENHELCIFRLFQGGRQNKNNQFFSVYKKYTLQRRWMVKGVKKDQKCHIKANLLHIEASRTFAISLFLWVNIIDAISFHFTKLVAICGSKSPFPSIST